MAFSTTGTSRGEGLSPEINVTPLIDVLLVMLIILMVIVPVTPRGLNSALPSAAASGVAEAGGRRSWCRWSKGRRLYGILWTVLTWERAEVAPRLLELLSRRSVRQVRLRADAKLDFGLVAGVIDAGRTVGTESVRFLTPGSDRLPR
jgi:biopolymer transport protein TolR